MARSRVELFEQIRRDWRAGGSSIREMAVRHHVHRRTVRQALASAVPPPRKAYPPRPPADDRPYPAIIDGWLLADRDVPRKWRHTARRIWQRLVGEHGASLVKFRPAHKYARRQRPLTCIAAVTSSGPAVACVRSGDVLQCAPLP
jgi:transposase